MKLMALTARSATFSTEYGSAYFAPSAFEVKLNGRSVREREERNVFSLFSLAPDTEYEVEADGKKLAFRTKKESLFLNVKDFGAAGDLSKNDCPAFVAAVACAEDGSTVYVPAGDYLLTPVFLKSGVTLYLEKGARLVGETDRTQYPILPGVTGDGRNRRNFGTWQGEEADCFASVITAVGCKISRSRARG